jgi:hypothetical protein
MASKKTAPLPALPAIADELGQIEKEYAIAIAPLKQKLERAKVLEKTLRELCPAKPDEEWNVIGQRFTVRLGPCAKEKSIDYKKLLTLIPLKAFVKFATCTLSALAKNVADDVFNSVVSEAPTGSRRITTQEKGAATA